MCLIIDANIASLFFKIPADPAFLPAFQWINNQKGALVLGGRNKRELFILANARTVIAEWIRAGKAHQIPDATVDHVEALIAASNACTSDDPHVLALAKVSGARTLCTHDDALQADFTDYRFISNPRGKIYKRQQHVRLLIHTHTCPGPN